MAYPTVSAPYGLRSVNEIGGLSYAGSTRMFPIAKSYGSNLFTGDIVQLSNGGLVACSYSAASSPTTAIAGTIGVFVGTEYTLPTGPIYGKIRTQMWTASTAANDAIGYVIDDPRAVFQAVVGSYAANTVAVASSGIGYMNPAFVGTNVYPAVATGQTTYSASGNTTTGTSGLSVVGTAPTVAGTGNLRMTTAAPFRVVGVVPETKVSIQATCSTSGSSTTVTAAAAADVVSVKPGMQLICETGTGSSYGNFVTVVGVSSATITVSSAVTLASGSVVTFVGYPEVLVTWNGSFHSYNNTTGV